MRNRFAALLLGGICFATSASTARSAPADYDFKDPKGVNTIVFMLDSKLEPIMGVAGGISGKVTFDPTNPTATKGTIALDVKSIHTPNRGMKNKIQAEDWLDGRHHPKIEFTFKSIQDVKTLKKGVYEMNLVGELTCKGITKEIKTTVTATHMPGKLSSRVRNSKGDLLVLRSHFTINRKDFNIKPEMGGDAVSEEIELRLSIVGGHVTK